MEVMKCLYAKKATASPFSYPCITHTSPYYTAQKIQESNNNVYDLFNRINQSTQPIQDDSSVQTVSSIGSLKRHFAMQKYYTMVSKVQPVRSI
jgi:hypothetical protein